MLLGEHIGERPPLLSPTWAPPDGVLLSFHLRVTVPADRAGVRGDAGLDTADLGVVTTRYVIVKKAELPSA